MLAERQTMAILWLKSAFVTLYNFIRMWNSWADFFSIHPFSPKSKFNNEQNELPLTL